MSLDVHLIEKHDICEHCGRGTEENHVFEANVTHNLNTMADKAGIYNYLWQPDEIGITQAHQLIEPLRAGLTLLRSNPAWFRTFEPENKWGTYDNFIPWLERYLAACEEYPEAYVSVSR